MTAIPNNYKPFLIQKMGSGNPVKDSSVQWGMVVKSFPFKFLPEAKDPAKEEWYDSDGDDEYVATMHFRSYEIEADFIITADDTTSAGSTTTSDAHIRTNLRAFFNYIKNGEFRIFDTYTGIGRQKVRYVKFDENSFMRRMDHSMLSFRITFKVNDPVTDITLTPPSQ